MTWRPTLRPTGVAIGAVMVAIILGSVYLDLQHRSPGPISSAHASLAAFKNKNDCAICHGGDNRTMTESCLQCHRTIGEQLADGHGLHGRLEDALATRCSKCHSDHHGRDFQATNYRSFKLAGIVQVRQYDHAGLSFGLTGKHMEVACEACHVSAWKTTLLDGEKRFQGLQQQCTACHQDEHKGLYGPDCNSCHGQQEPFARAPGFEHTHAFLLEGAHRRATCQECHPAGSDRSVGLLMQSRRANQTPRVARTCRACHESPHAEVFLAMAAERWSSSSDQSCQHCHLSQHETFCGQKATVDLESHRWTGFALEAPHDQLACRQCHTGFGSEKIDVAAYRACYPGRQADDCRACHGDPHQGQFDEGPFRDSDCLTCHTRRSFTPSTFSAAEHARARFPLRGAHQNVACEQCHILPPEPLAGHRPNEVRTPGAVGRDASRLELVSAEIRAPGPAVTRIYHGTPMTCGGCHEDVHRGEFSSGPFRGLDCAACHTEIDFRRTLFTLEQHRQTDFPLTGAHQAVACRSCHRAPAEQPAVPGALSPAAARQIDHSSRRRPRADRKFAVGIFGQLPGKRVPDQGLAEPPVFSDAPTACSECHRDVHQGRFDRRGLPVTLDGRTGCARCHATEQFDHVRAADFDHGTWTGYVLKGAHSSVACITCHAGRPDQPDRRLGPSPGTSCQSCHADPHAGQFGTAAEANCAQCHREETTFQDLLFDHQTDSTFALDADHERLACSACHRRQRLRNGGTAVRYKPLGKLCGDCHIAAGPRRATTGRQR